MKLLSIIMVTSLLLLAGCSSSKYSKEQLDKLANCLADKGVKEYGAFWCPNCAKQQKMFGKSYTIIKERSVYVECDPRGEKEQSELCIEKKVEKYPTWEFADGTVIVGVQEFETLAQKSGCSFQ